MPDKLTVATIAAFVLGGAGVLAWRLWRRKP